MKFTFLGTGTSQGVPVIACPCPVCQSADPHDQRLRTSGLLSGPEGTLVLDAGPDFRQQMLRHGVTRLDAVVLTHSHKDHIAGLDDVRAFNYLQNMDMPVYGNAHALEQVQREFAYVFEENPYPGVPKMVLHTLNEAPFVAAGMELTPVPVQHGNLPVLGFRTGDFAYVTDAKVIPHRSMELLAGVKVLVLNALRKTPHHSHLTLDEAIAIGDALQVNALYLTHISHLLGFHAEVSADLPGGVHLAFDGLVLEV